MKIVSPRTSRDLRTLGRHITAARKIHGLTAELLAERAGITRPTLHRIEHGEGGVHVDAVLSVLRVLGAADAVVSAADPLNTDFGRLNADRAVRARVRNPGEPQ